MPTNCTLDRINQLTGMSAESAEFLSKGTPFAPKARTRQAAGGFTPVKFPEGYDEQSQTLCNLRGSASTREQLLNDKTAAVGDFTLEVPNGVTIENDYLFRIDTLNNRLFRIQGNKTLSGDGRQRFAVVEIT
jgi:hypothetical protein